VRAVRDLIGRLRRLELGASPVSVPGAVLYLPRNGRDVEDPEHELPGASRVRAGVVLYDAPEDDARPSVPGESPETKGVGCAKHNEGGSEP
jgi:hypothetical protein